MIPKAAWDAFVKGELPPVGRAKTIRTEEDYFQNLEHRHLSEQVIRLQDALQEARLAMERAYGDMAGWIAYTEPYFQ